MATSARANEFEFFESRVRPILVEHCYACHSAESEKLKSGLFLDSREGIRKGGDSGKPAIIPGNAEASRLIEAVSYKNKDLQMPPPKAGKLKEAQITDLVTWINMGAPDPRTNSSAIPATLADKYNEAKTHWAFQPVKNPPVPAVKNQKQVQTPIDNFILAKLEDRDLTLTSPAGRRTLIRRATFDLTGLPPTPEEVDAFVADKSPEAFARVVDRLLASPRYGERWGRYWLDVARFADTKGYVYGGREEAKFIQSAAYRDWIIGAFNADMPYDRFLKLQIAADQMEGADLNSLAAMGYLTLGRRFLGVVHDIIDDRIDVVMRGTQALTVGCARCHDHKFDPIPTKDYYSLYGVFAGSNERQVPLNSGTAPAKAYLDFEVELKKREEKFYSTFNAKREEQSKRLRSKVAEYLVAVLDVEKLHNEDFYSFVQADDINPVIVRAWHSYLLSSAKTVHPVWAPWHAYSALPTNEFAARAEGVLISLTNATPKLNPVVEKAFAEKPPGSMREVAEVYGKLLTGVDKKWVEAADKKKALSKDEDEVRQVLYAENSPASVPSGAIVDMEWYFDEPTRVELGGLSVKIEQWILQSTGAPPHAVILEDRPHQRNPYVFKRGNPSSKGEQIPKQFLEILAGENRKPFTKGSGRLELAEAIASPDNPLTARVFVNRVWLYHFGAGLVGTPSDFGTRAEPPTHPELLDWLANAFMEGGWSVKKLHRLILLSAVYQQGSDRAELSPDETTSRIQRVSNRNGDSDLPDSTIDPENKYFFRFNRQRLDFEALRDSLLFVSGQLDLKVGGKAEEMFKTPFSKRRSVYGFIDRQFLPGPLRIFDFASPDMHAPQRSETTVPQQALFFLNGAFVVEQAKALAARSGAGGGDTNAASPEAKISRMHRLLYQREPTAGQLKNSLNFLAAASAAISNKPVVARAPSAWKYGYGEFDEAGKQLKSFETLPHFSGDAWQGGKSWPDATLGWAQLTATGGHAGNDLQHAVIRRWVAPVDGAVEISGSIKHTHPEGHGIRASIFAQGKDQLGKWTLHNQAAEANVPSIEVKQGDTIDFIVSIDQSLSYNDFLWAPVIRLTGPIREANGYAQEWNAQKDFGGTPPEPREPLTAWEEYAQVLLLSNEFLFID